MSGRFTPLILFLVIRVGFVVHEWLHALLRNLCEAIVHFVYETRFQDASEAMGWQGAWPAALSTPLEKIIPRRGARVFWPCADILRKRTWGVVIRCHLSQEVDARRDRI